MRLSCTLKLLCCCFALFPTLSNAKYSITEIIHLGMNIVEYIDFIWNTVNHGEISFLHSSDILNKFDGVISWLGALHEENTELLRTLSRIQDSTTSNVRWELRMNSLENLIRPVEVLFQRFQQYRHSNGKMEADTLREFSQSLISHSPGSVMNLLDEIHYFVNNTNNGVDGIFKHLKDVLQVS